MGVGTSKSKRDSRSERRANHPKLGKKTSVTGKGSVLMTTLENTGCTTSLDGEGIGADSNGSDSCRTALPESRGTTRAWIEAEEPRELDGSRCGTVQVEQQFSDASQQRTNCEELEIFDIDPEPEMTPRATSGHQEKAAICVATEDVADRTSSDHIIAVADEDVDGERSSRLPLPLPPEVARVRNEVRVSTGGVMTTGILTLPNVVFHGDGLPDVELVTHDNQRKTSIVESALLARCHPWTSVERENPYSNSSHNGNIDWTKRNIHGSFPGSYASAYGCSCPPACPGLVGDVLLCLSKGKGDYTGTGAADSLRLKPDRSSCEDKTCALVLMESGVNDDAAAADAQLPVAGHRLHPTVDRPSLTEQVSNQPKEEVMDHGAWLALEEMMEQTSVKQSREEMSERGADTDVEESAEKMANQVAEKMTEQTKEKTKYRYAAEAVVEKLIEQMAEQLSRSNAVEKLHPKTCPVGDAPAPRLEAAEAPEWMEEADGERRTVESDENPTEEAAKEDVADIPEELDSFVLGHRNDAPLDRTLRPFTILCSSSSGGGNSNGADAGRHGDGLRDSGLREYAASRMEQSETVFAGVQEGSCHGDAAHARGAAEQYVGVVADVQGDCIFIHATAEHRSIDGMALLEKDADGASEKTGHSTGQEGVNDDVPDGAGDPRPGCSANGNGSQAEPMWSDSEVMAYDEEVAWSDAWAKWSDVQATQKTSGERKGKGGGRKGKGGGKAKPSRDRPLL